MKFTLNWLRSFLKTNADLDEICYKLTNIGLEIESVETKDDLAKLIIAEIIEASPHPNADKLQILQVNIGEGSPIQIICGAKNARKGLKAVLAPIGTYLPELDVTIKKSSIRGVESLGMMCSYREIGIENEADDGIIELGKDAEIGKKFADYAGLDISPLIEVAITPNRGDCASVYGIARDLAATNIGELIEPNLSQLQNWQAYLHAIKTPIDLASYLTLSYGMPIVALDKDKLMGEVRLSQAGEGVNFTGADGKNYALTSSSLILKDEQNIIALAGLMASEQHKVTQNTKNILLTAINCQHEAIIKTAKELNINNQCSYRYERNIDKQNMYLPEIDNCSYYICQDKNVSYRIIDIDLVKINNYVGSAIDSLKIQEILTNLGFIILEENSEKLKIKVPSWRHDISLDVDIISEIVRIYNLDNIEPAKLDLPENLNRPKNQDYKNIFTPDLATGLQAKQILASCGFSEIMSWSFISTKQAEHFGGGTPELKLQNPISSGKNHMRPSLMPGLLQAASYNIAHFHKNLALFEVSYIYKTANYDGQILHAAAIRHGEIEARNWRSKPRIIDVFDAKKDICSLLEGFDINLDKLSYKTEAPSYYHPTRSASIFYKGDLLGYFGELHPDSLAFMDIGETICGFEINLQILSKYKHKKKPYQTKQIQDIYRDLAFIIDERQAAIELQKLSYAQSPFISEVTIFDVYRGESIGENKKSIALQLKISPEKNITSEEIDHICQKVIIAIIEKTNASLRCE